MKKVLMGTSALALVGAMSTPADAVEWDVSFGGFMTQNVGFASTDADNIAGEDVDGFDVHSNTEIIFTPSITLDNGIQFGVNVQLEGNTSGDQIDESYMFIDGSFGEVLIGGENSAGYKMTYAAPNVTTMPINSGSASAFIPFSGVGGGPGGVGGLFRNAMGSSFIETEGGINNDSQRITYFSPRFAGFQVGASYARDGDGGGDGFGQPNLNGGISDFFDVGANYVNSFGGFDVAVSGRYGIADNDAPGADDPESMAFGANVGFAGITVGYAFAENNNHVTRPDSQGHNAGISYETGPWGVSATYYRGEGLDNDVAGPGGTGLVPGADETYEAINIGGSYALAKGVTTSVFGVYVDADEDFSDTGARGGDDIDGFVIGAGIGLSF